MSDNEVSSTEKKSPILLHQEEIEDGMLSSDGELSSETCIKVTMCLEKNKEDGDEKEEGALSTDGELSSDEDDDKHEELDYGDDSIDVIKTSQKSAVHKKEKEEEGELSSSPDEGELSEEECSEDGEIRDDDNTLSTKAAYSLLPNASQQEYSNLGSAHKSNGLCRFFMRGNCTWGNQCRFLHPISKNDTPVVESIAAVIPSEMKDDRQGESSWERGIRQAKEAKQTASKRKTEDINFEEKKLHQQLPEGSPTKREPSPESDAGSAQGEKNQSQRRRRRSIPNEVNYRPPPPFFPDQMRPPRPFYPGGQWNNGNFAPPFSPHGGMGPGPMMMGPGPDGFGPPPFPGPFMGPRHPFPQDARMLIEEKRRQQMMFEQHNRFNTPDGPRNERYGQPMDQYQNKGNRDNRGDDRRNRVDRKSNIRADSWKDPWQRTQRSPKNRSHMDSRSRSRGRSSARGSRRSSYSSSYSSSSYSSRSSSFSSYSSRSSFDSRSRSSSRSRSRSSNDSRSRSVRDKRTVTTVQKDPKPNNNKNNNETSKTDTRSQYSSRQSNSSYGRDSNQVNRNQQSTLPEAYNTGAAGGGGRGRNNNSRGRSHNGGRVNSRNRDTNRRDSTSRRYGNNRNSATYINRRNSATGSPSANTREGSPLRKVEVRSNNSQPRTSEQQQHSGERRSRRGESQDKRRHTSRGRSKEVTNDDKQSSQATTDNMDKNATKSERVNANRSMAFAESVIPEAKESPKPDTKPSRKRERKNTTCTDSDFSGPETPAKRRTRDRVKMQFTNTSNVLKKKDILPVETDEEEVPLVEPEEQPKPPPVVEDEPKLPIVESTDPKKISDKVENEIKQEQEQLAAAVAKVNKPVVKGKETRREELLKQLKAVEDAIARKRAKVS